MGTKHYFTSESVSEGHPDKVSDRISDEIVDAFLKQDPEARVACETLVTTNRIVIAGEVRGPAPLVNSDGSVNDEIIESIARKAVKDIGYAQDGFHHANAEIANHLHGQSSDIAQGVDASGNKDEGAGDQGLMFGYAINETEDLMPAPVSISHKILSSMAAARHDGTVKGLGPDSKSQVTLVYEDDKPISCASVVVSTQHEEGMSQEDVRQLVRPYVENSMPKGWMCAEENFYVNPTGKFVIGGPDGDAGLTGRKIIVDTYGGAAPHGGGAFSGKDPTKVDRSAAYAARYLAKNIVAAGYGHSCLIQVSYAIGVSKPLSLLVKLAEADTALERKLEKAVAEVMDLSPRGIREKLNLNRPIYAPTSAYGHFGRKASDAGHFSWEKLDLIDDLKSAMS